MINSYDIQRIMATDLTEEDLTVFIEDAYAMAGVLLITEELVIKYLCAHMIQCTRDRPAKSEEAGGAKVEYDGVLGAGLLSTAYGQLAVNMDVTGKLAELSQQKRKAWIKAIKS